jgi:hypothetical protein
MTAVDVENLARHEGRGLEVENRVDDVLHFAHASEHWPLGHRVEAGLRVHRRLDDARRDGVDAHASPGDLDGE